MPLGQGTVVVDGQRNIAPPVAAFLPAHFGQQTTAVPQSTPIIPPYASSVGAGAVGSTGSASVGGYGTAENNGAVTAVANANPHNWKVSPVWWAVTFLVGGLLLLNAINWHETVDESAGIGGTHESAKESAGS